MSDWSLRRRLTITFVAATILAMVAFVVGIVSFTNLLDARNRLVDRLDPAAVAQRDALAAMINQENGVRGFTLTADDRFLAPYVDGTDAAVVAAERLHELLDDEPVPLASLDEAIATAAEWRAEFAEPEIARVRSSGPGEPSEDILLRGQDLFDGVRQSLGDLENDIADERNAARDDLDDATQVLLGALAFIVLVVLAVGALAWLAFVRWTLRPLDHLGAGTRAVADGDLDLELRPEGPPEIARLGADVEAMRRRIVADVAQVEAARLELDERARDLARSNADLEQFAYVASHDLQEPLRKVTSFCQLLQRRYAGQLDERADQYIEFAVDGARRMQTLINDLLSFSRVGRNATEFTEQAVSKLVDRALADLDAQIAEAGASVVVGDLPTIQGDATLLTMLFRNLVGNAVKFRGERPPIVKVGAEPLDDEWHFRVSDNGIGIDPEYADKVFVIFQRLHTRETYEGTGIGLALAKKIVEFHGGRIWIDEPELGGTTISFTFPRDRSTS